jgi:hypothetical protein
MSHNFRGMGNHGNNGGRNNNFGNQNFVQLMNNYIGQTVTVFTTSGGASGCGFTGVVLDVNGRFIRLSNHQGTPPANPLSESICGDMFGDNDGGSGGRGRGGNGNYNSCGRSDRHHYPVFTVGSVCDIPVDRIAAFCHNAI